MDEEKKPEKKTLRCRNTKTRTQETPVVQTSKKKTSIFRSLTKGLDIIMSIFRKYVPEFICLSLFAIFVLWAYGYLMNGWYGTAFALDSSIAAIGAISSAGVLSLIRYLTDSKLNSALGSKPTKALTDKINRYISGGDFVDENHNGIDDRQETQNKKER